MIFNRRRLRCLFLLSVILIAVTLRANPAAAADKIRISYTSPGPQQGRCSLATNCGRFSREPDGRVSQFFAGAIRLLIVFSSAQRHQAAGS